MDKIHFLLGEYSTAFFYIFVPALLGYFMPRVGAKLKDNFLFYYVLIGVAVQGLVTGVIQIYNPDLVINYVQWPYSPFLYELGMANLAFGFLGVISLWKNSDWRKSAAFGYGLFLLITGVGHLVQIWNNGLTPGDFGGFLFSDLVVGIILLALTR